jgi:hypothetical protein
VTKLQPNATALAELLEQAKERITRTLNAYADAPDTACVPGGDCILLGDLRALLNAAPASLCLSADISGELFDAQADGRERGPYFVTLHLNSFNPYRVALVFREAGR